MRGDNNPAKRPEVRKKISLAKKAYNPGMVIMRKMHIQRPTSIEITMRDSLIDAGVAFEQEYRVTPYFLDFAIVNSLIDIECDGAYWHNLPTVKAHDAIRDKFLVSRGWTIFRFSGDAIRADITACIDDIIAHLKGLGVDPTATRKNRMFGRQLKLPF